MLFRSFDYARGTSVDTFAFGSWPKENPPFVIPQSGKATKPLPERTARQLCKPITDKNRHADCVFDVMVTGHPGFAKTYLLDQRILNGRTSIVLRGVKEGNPGESAKFTAIVTKAMATAGVVQRAQDQKAAPVGLLVPVGSVQSPLMGKN